MGTQKGKLFELARMYRTYQKTKEQPEKKSTRNKVIPAKGQHFDEGKAISLTYNLDLYPESLRESHGRQAASFSLWDNDHSEAFYVEPFDNDETVEVPYRDVTDESEDDKLDKIARGFSSNSEEQEHEDLADDEEQLGEMSKKIDDMFKSDDDDDEEEESDSMSAEVDNTYPEEEAGAKANQEEDLPLEVVAETVKSSDPSLAYDASDEEFARDIGAILTGQKLYDSDSKKTVGKGGSSASASNGSKPQVPAKSAAGTGDDLLDPNKNEHKIFEKIAQSMTYANSYDLGAIALDEKFDLMDREIEKQEIKTVLQTKPSEKTSSDEIQEADVVDDEKPEVSKSFSEARYDSKVPLDNTNGGRLIKSDHLQKGDVIIAGTSSDSIGGVYLGNEKVMTKGDRGILVVQDLDNLMGGKTVVTALRHDAIDPSKGALVADDLVKLNADPVKGQPVPWFKISIPTVRVHADICKNAGAEKEMCVAFNGKINLGASGNDSFQFTDSMIGVFAKHDVPLVPLMSKEHNGSLRYFGHLKNKA